MQRLAEVISKYGGVMRELGQVESRRSNAQDDAHKEMLDKDLEKVAVRLAEAKLALLSAKSKDGGSLIDWNEDEANAMFSMVEPQTEQKGTAPGA